MAEVAPPAEVDEGPVLKQAGCSHVWANDGMSMCTVCTACRKHLLEGDIQYITRHGPSTALSHRRKKRRGKSSEQTLFLLDPHWSEGVSGRIPFPSSRPKHTRKGAAVERNLVGSQVNVCYEDTETLPN